MSIRTFAEQFNRMHVGVMLLTSSMAALGGAVLGAKVALDKYGEQLRKDADEALQVEAAKIESFYKTLAKKEEYSTPVEALEALHPGLVVLPEKTADQMTNYHKMAKRALEPEIEPEPELVEVAQNVFTDAAYIQEPFDYETELKRRDPDRPYLITEEEFLEGDLEHEQTQFTYYAGDGVLTNSGEDVIQDIDAIIGEENLMRFGHGSNDENIVFIRNVKLEMDIEIAKSPGKYSEEVLNEDDEPATELRHSQQRFPRRSSFSDD